MSIREILVVDDDPDHVELVKSTLSEDYVVHGATTAREAQDIWEGRPIELLISDVRMPDVNGFILVGRAQRAIPGLKTILISAYYDESDYISRSIVKRYAEVCLAKPFRSGVLKDVVRQVMAQDKAYATIAHTSTDNGWGD